MPGTSCSNGSSRVPGGLPAVVGLGHSLGDRRQVQQVARGLRDEGRPATGVGGGGIRRSSAGAARTAPQGTRTAPRLRRPRIPAGPQQGRHPDPFRPIRATTAPWCSSRSTLARDGGPVGDAERTGASAAGVQGRCPTGSQFRGRNGGGAARSARAQGRASRRASRIGNGSGVHPRKSTGWTTGATVGSPGPLGWTR